MLGDTSKMVGTIDIVVASTRWEGIALFSIVVTIVGRLAVAGINARGTTFSAVTGITSRAFRTYGTRLCVKFFTSTSLTIVTFPAVS